MRYHDYPCQRNGWFTESDCPDGGSTSCPLYNRLVECRMKQEEIDELLASFNKRAERRAVKR